VDTALDDLSTWRASLVSGATPGTDRLLQRQLLHGMIRQRFNLSELATLAYTLGIEWDDLQNGTLDEAVRSLVLHSLRHKQQKLLLDHLRQLRPDDEWPDLV
jgi:hypothetical protein